VNKDTIKAIEKILPHEADYLDKRIMMSIKPVYCPTTNKVYFQTDPYLDQYGKIVIKRLAVANVTIEQMGSVVEEYEVQST